MKKDSFPVVSIGIPTYNRPEGLRRTLECITNQTYSNIEVIVSDNCSNNFDIDDVIKHYSSDPRITFYKQPQNRGALFNFNFVLEKATGDYFMRLADDDWVDTNYIETCLHFLQQNPGYALAYGKVSMVTSDGRFITNDASINLEESSADKRVIEYFNKVMENGVYYGLIRRDIMRHAIAKKKLADDWLAVARIASIGKIKMLETTNSYMSKGGISQSIDSITTAFNMSDFTRSFPYLAVGLNIVEDILWKSSAYKKLNALSKMKLACHCFYIVYRRFGVRREFLPGVKKYVRLMAKA